MMIQMTPRLSRAVWSHLYTEEPDLARRIIHLQSATTNKIREDWLKDDDFGPVMESFGLSNTMFNFMQLIFASMRDEPPSAEELYELISKAASPT